MQTDSEEEKWTTITVRVTTRDRLEQLKIHPKQSYDEILTKMLDSDAVKEFKAAKELLEKKK